MPEALGVIDAAATRTATQPAASMAAPARNAMVEARGCTIKRVRGEADDSARHQSNLKTPLR
jgi:hypothetical protein